MKQVLKDVFEKHSVSLAYLFGSVLHNNTGPMSDVDIAVQFNKSESVDDRIKRQSSLASELEDIVGKTVDLIDLEETTSPLLRHRIITRGELLYCTNHKMRQELERKSLHEFEDTRHLRAVQNMAMKKRIKSGMFGKPL